MSYKSGRGNYARMVVCSTEGRERQVHNCKRRGGARRSGSWTSTPAAAQPLALRALLSRSELHNLCLIGAFRDNEVTAAGRPSIRATSAPTSVARSSKFGGQIAAIVIRRECGDDAGDLAEARCL